MAQINGFDYRSQRPVRKSKKEWRAELRAAVKAGAERRVVEGETLIMLPMEEDLGAPFGKRRSRVLAVEIYANIPL